MAPHEHQFFRHVCAPHVKTVPDNEAPPRAFASLAGGTLTRMWGVAQMMWHPARSARSHNQFEGTADERRPTVETPDGLLTPNHLWTVEPFSRLQPLRTASTSIRKRHHLNMNVSLWAE